MPDFGLIIYDKPRAWIRECRTMGINWEDIDSGRQKNCADLQKFLDTHFNISFWPEMSISDWKLLVQSERYAEENSKKIDLIDGIAHIHDEQQDNAITIPQDPASSWQLYRGMIKAWSFWGW